jgi:outer membrane protein OmpA-like peptidoglycan-associated protein/Tol biopolymer transport system component
MKHIILLLIYFFVSYFTCLQTSSAQTKDTPFTKDQFPDRKKELKEALKHIEEGDSYIEVDGNYNAALASYIKAYTFNPNNAVLNMKIGKCYIFGANVSKEESVTYFERAYQLNPNVDIEILKYLGEAHQFNYEWVKAIDFYEKYKKTTTNKEEITFANKRIQECQNGRELEKKPIRVFIDNLGTNVNSKYPEYTPVITTDESVMYFTSKRSDTQGGGIDPSDGHFYEDVYRTTFDGKNWSTPVNVGKPINSERNDATVGLSPDGSRLLVFEEGDIYECDLKGTTWTRPEKLSDLINTKHNETSASFSFDGKKLYFVSNRPDLTIGGSDIYVSELDAKGKWGAPKNLGPPINTPEDEEAVFIHPDGKTMYFSSKGHKGIGGYDIYKSTYENGAWSAPVNLGMPINTPEDDVFLVVSGSGRFGYYSSSRKGGEGEQDIYRVTFLGPEKQVILNNEELLLASIAEPLKEKVVEKEIEVSSNQLTIFRGVTLDSLKRTPVAAKIVITNNTDNKTLSEMESNSSTGKFLVTLPSGKNYGIAIKADGYLFYSENFDLPEGGNFQLVEKEVLLKKIEVGSKIVLRNIFFDTDKATLRPESKTELDNLLRLLVENPTIKIEISGHTDNQGSASYNQVLSEKRAKAVVDYLGDNVEKTRMVYVGYGLTQPVATNATAQGRQLNRRTELKILSK